VPSSCELRPFDGFDLLEKTLDPELKLKARVNFLGTMNLFIGIFFHATLLTQI
jgi:hypothetical protein